jgi:chromosome segregation ATPase
MKAISRGRPTDAGQESTSASKILTVALALVCMVSICRGDEAIGTTNGTYVLADVNSLATPSARQGADRTAQLALAGLTEDSAGYEKELKDVEEKIAAHNQSVEQLNKELSEYQTALNAYNAKLEPHNSQVAKYNSEVADQRAQVAQSNSLPPKQRSQVTVNRLNQWKTRLDKRKTELNREKSDLDAQKASMDPKALTLNSRSQTINDEAQQLNAEKAAIKVKLGDAYRQLKLCYDYSVQLEEMLRKDGVLASADNRQMLNSASATLERLKTVSSEGSITNAEKTSFNSGSGESSASGTPQE